MLERRQKLGDMLVEAGVIDDLQRSVALGEQRRFGGKLASVLIHLGLADEKVIAPLLEKQRGQKCILLRNKEIPQNVLSVIKPDVAKKYKVIPLGFERRTLIVATPDPDNLGSLDDLSFMLGINIKPMLALEYDIKNAITRYYS